MRNRRFALVLALGVVLAVPGLSGRPQSAVAGSMWKVRQVQIHNWAHTPDGYSGGGCHGGPDVSNAPVDD